jgi:hypothetical protein
VLPVLPQRRWLPDDQQLPVSRFTSDHGEVVVTRTAPKVVVVTMTGDVDIDGGEHFETWLDIELREPAHLFWDVFDLKSYATGVRELSVQVMQRHREHILSVHVGATSKVVILGMHLANMAMGGIIKAHHSRLSFDVARNALQ